ncbi:hypothetical protein SUGI_0539160 [Cryptomeria japonica]|nr:hypothetical protein SUGI_0539160 [Cryptomeria japonica]
MSYISITMPHNIVSNHTSSKRVVHSEIWSELPDGVIESILKWFPYELLVRLRTVCKDWNNLVSRQNFLTWRGQNFKENPWLLIVNEKHDCYRFKLSTKEAKAFPMNYKVLASVGGILLLPGSSWGELFLCNPFTGRGIQIPPREDISKGKNIIVCNPARETFVQLPPPIISKENGILLGDILWKGKQYQVVAVHDTFIEVYDFTKRSWVIVQQLPGRYITDIIFFKGLYFCTVLSFNGNYAYYYCGWSVEVLSIKENCTCQMVHLSMSSPVYRQCCMLMTPELVVCGSALFLITRHPKQLCLWELEYDNNNLSITSNLSWKVVAKMPKKVWKFLFDRPGKFLATGNHICFICEVMGKVALFNTENGSWSCFTVDESIAITFYAYLYDPRPDISFQ